MQSIVPHQFSYVPHLYRDYPETVLCPSRTNTLAPLLSFPGSLPLLPLLPSVFVCYPYPFPLWSKYISFVLRTEPWGSWVDIFPFSTAPDTGLGEIYVLLQSPQNKATARKPKQMPREEELWPLVVPQIMVNIKQENLRQSFLPPKSRGEGGYRAVENREKLEEEAQENRQRAWSSVTVFLRCCRKQSW